MNAVLLLTLVLSAAEFQVLQQAGEIERISPPVADATAQASSAASEGEQFLLADGARLVLGGEGMWVEAAGNGRLLVAGDRHLRWRGLRLETVVAGEPLKLDTDAGTIRLPEGRYRVRQAGATTAVEVLAGEPAQSFSGADLYTIAAGRGMVFQAGEVSEGALPEAPRIVSPRPHESLKAFRFQWTSREDYAGYVWEIAQDPEFKELLLRAQTTEPVFSRPSQSLPIGLLYWRVSAVSANGLEGLPTEPIPLRVAP